MSINMGSIYNCLKIWLEYEILLLLAHVIGRVSRLIFFHLIPFFMYAIDVEVINFEMACSTNAPQRRVYSFQVCEEATKI